MNSLLRSLLKLVLLASATIVVLGLLLIGLSAALLTLVWSLLTGRKPAAFTTFMRFREASRQFQSRAWSAGGTPAARQPDDDIVDVQAHEVRGAIGRER
ncbi:MAG: hypothetical protein HXX19_02275 [Rhodoferax sp.]|nr:hypothetical protein [Rhodoferax sp.]